jgi:hypothetical protein
MELFTALLVLHWDWTAQDVTVTARLAAGEVPQALLAVTVRIPPADPAVAVIRKLSVVPIHPAGNVQAYRSAPNASM